MKAVTIAQISRVAVPLLVLASICACMPSKAIVDWDNASSADTIPAYEKLIRNFPDDKKYVEKAKRRIEELEWEETKKYDTALSYTGHLKKYPSGQFAKEAAKLACQRAAGISNIQLPIIFWSRTPPAPMWMNCAAI